MPWQTFPLPRRVEATDIAEYPAGAVLGPERGSGEDIDRSRKRRREDRFGGVQTGVAQKYIGRAGDDRRHNRDRHLPFKARSSLERDSRCGAEIKLTSRRHRFSVFR